MTEVERPVALVTGAGGGIGKAIALRLAADGFAIALVSRTGSALEECAKEIRAAGGSAIVVPCDITDPAAVEEGVTEIAGRMGRVDVVVNNAGADLIAPLLETELDAWRAVIDVNLTGPFLVLRAAGPLLFESPQARVINVSSIFAVAGASQWTAYSAAKGGVLSLTRALAIEWARHGVRVNAVLPGNVETPMTSEALADPRMLELAISRTPVRRVGQPEDITPVVSLLAAPSSDFITGQTFTVDGGFTAR